MGLVWFSRLSCEYNRIKDDIEMSYLIAGLYHGDIFYDIMLCFHHSADRSSRR